MGGAVAQVAKALGTPLMPWQRMVADVALELDPATGRLAYRQIGLTVPRQSGKTTLLEAILARTGAVPRQGNVEAGTTVGDGSKEARDHRMGVELSVATAEFMGDSYTFIDCPGSIEFIHDMRAATVVTTSSSSLETRPASWP